MRIKLNIEYDASAEEGENKADEEAALEFIEGFLQGFIEQLSSEAKAAGLTMNVS
jgi:hypothetical protein